MTTPQLLPDRSSPPSSNEPIALAPSMIEAVSRAHAFAPAATPIILYGESGTGKTFFAEYIHELSGRSGGFHAFSVGNLAPQLALDELFGHVRGAFTDARENRRGQFAIAGSGTLLLDDVHTLDLSVQKQLLQVLDRGTYSPLGSDRLQTVVCRIILAMTENPDRLMQKGQLLIDLRYRFGECAIEIPPLRERRAEIRVYAECALRYWAEKTHLDGPTAFCDGALALLERSEYRGNVRELEGIVLSAFLLARYKGASEIDMEHLPSKLRPSWTYHRHGDRSANRAAVERALQMTGGNITNAAQLLNVSRTTVTAMHRAFIREDKSGHMATVQ